MEEWRGQSSWLPAHEGHGMPEKLTSSSWKEEEASKMEMTSTSRGKEEASRADLQYNSVTVYDSSTTFLYR
jgi:hypothetical protein